MKTRILLAILAAALSFSSHAMTGSRLRAIKSQLSLAPVAELPQTASRLIKDAASSEQTTVARVVLDWIAQHRPSAFPQSAAAISKFSRQTLIAAATPMDGTKPGGMAALSQVREPLRASEYIQIHNAAGPASKTIPTASAAILNGPPVIVVVTTSDAPINTMTGGAGDGTFNGATVDTGPTVIICDYHAPRT